MSKRPVKVMVSAGTIEDFFKRAREDARKLDRKQLLAPEIRVTFEDPLEMMRALSAERMKVIKFVRDCSSEPTLSKLALLLKRDRKAVSRDVKMLESFGLLKTRMKTNPGHGTMKVVEPLARKYVLTATI